MTQTIAAVTIFVVLLALLPTAIKWMQARSVGGLPAVGLGTKVISAVAVGPQQRVVTIEVGPPDARTCLVLGVTAQSISCLHGFGAPHGGQRQDVIAHGLQAVHS